MKRLPILLVLALAGRSAPPLVRGFDSAGSDSQRALEARAVAVPQPEKIREYMQRLSKEPHHAGSPAAKAVAEYGQNLLRSFGYETKIEVFEALLPYPKERLLEMTAPVHFKAKLHEPAIREDPDSNDRNQLPTYNAYSAAGDVTAQLVYVNYGLPEDYAELKKLGIDVRGKIVIARYGKSWRGTKPKVAQENGAAACLIYSDPRDDGYFMGDVYPKGPFRPPQSVQRGSVMDMPVGVGDPLSPGWASERGSKRLTLAEAKTIMKIPVQPISADDARPLLERLKGKTAPESWRGALPITYHIGPGPAVVRLKLDFDFSTRPMYNVIARLPGSVYPDQVVMYGNHHDAWVNGANDPNSGAAALLETARAIGELAKAGWKPKRTIEFALWDAEEFGLIGSTEWVEKYLQTLRQTMVAYLNSDTNGAGALSAGGSPTLEAFVEQVVRERKVRIRRDDGEKEFRLGPLGAGSDYVAFIHHGGIASLNLGFGRNDSAGVYHSIYDSYAWYSRFSDTDFSNGRALGQVMSTLILRLAEAPVLPFEFRGLSRAIREYVGEIRKEAGDQAGRLGIEAVNGEVERLQRLATAYEDALGRLTGRLGSVDPQKLAAINRAVYQTERALTRKEGLPGRSWYKYQISAPGMYTGYGAKTLPGIREAAEARRWDEASAQSKIVAATLANFNGRIEALLKLME